MRVGLGIILVVTCAIYSTLWSAPALTWDDGSNIFNNPFFTMHMWWGVWANAYYGLYVPVTSTVWAVLYYAGGGEAWPFRALNLLLHLANMILVYKLLEQLARKWRIEARVPLVAATAIFALHPLQVETVAWISGGRDLLATFFALTATALYFRRPYKVGYLGATVLFLLALLSKPNTVIVPLAILFLDWFFEQRTFKQSAKRMSLWFVLSMISIYLTELAQGEHFENAIEWWERPRVAAEYLGFYVQKFFWPHPLSGNYAFTPEEALSRPPFIAIATALGVAAAAFAIYKWNRRGAIAALILILLLPVSGLVPFGYEQISGVADHYMYLPMAAIAAVLMLAFAQLKPPAQVLPLVIAALCAGASFARTPAWKSDQAFFTDMARTSPESYSTALGMSVVMCEDVKNYEEGLLWIDRALKARPDDILALANRAYCLLNSNRNQEVIAMDSYLDRLDYKTLAETQPTAYSSLIDSIGTAMIKEDDYAMGFQYLCEAYRVLPSDANHANNLTAAAEILKAHGLEPKCRDNLFETSPVEPEAPE